MFVEFIRYSLDSILGLFELSWVESTVWRVGILKRIVKTRIAWNALMTIPSWSVSYLLLLFSKHDYKSRASDGFCYYLTQHLWLEVSGRWWKCTRWENIFYEWEMFSHLDVWRSHSELINCVSFQDDAKQIMSANYKHSAGVRDISNGFFGRKFHALIRKIFVLFLLPYQLNTHKIASKILIRNIISLNWIRPILKLKSCS